MAKTVKLEVMVFKLIPEMVNEMVLEGINQLLGVLSEGNKPMTLAELSRMVSSQTDTFVAMAGGEMVGMASLVVAYQPVGIVCHVEDVVVNSEIRRNGIGKALMTKLIASLPNGWRQLDLTSKPHRVPAHRLYVSLGFKLRETGNYRLLPAA